MQNPDYRKVFAISQSAIKAFKTKPIQKFKRIYIDGERDEEDDEDKYDFGSLVDTLAFTPDLLNDRFYIPDQEVEIPGDKVKTIVDNVFAESTKIREEAIRLNKHGNLPEPIYVQEEGNLGEWNGLILKYAREIKYGGSTWKEERIVDNVIDDGSKYFRLLGECRGRRIITPQENMDAIQIVEQLRTSKDIYKYFVQQEDETLLFQQEIFVDFQADELMVPLKGSLDILRINHKRKAVIVADLKTTHSVQEFRKKAVSYDYVTQLSFYTYITEVFLQEFRGGIYKDYIIEMPVNIAIDRETRIPYIYIYHGSDLVIAEKGSDAHNFVGWFPTLQDIAWHMKNGMWAMSREMYENGKVVLKIFK